jgi:hypothetical protein
VTDFAIRYGEHVTRARRDGRPVVALESTIISHGLPHPDNIRVARDIEQAVRDNGPVPATIGMIDGEVIVGLEDAQVERLASAEAVAKLSVRDRRSPRPGAPTGPPRSRPPARSPRRPASACSPPAGWAGCTGRRTSRMTSPPT